MKAPSWTPALARQLPLVFFAVFGGIMLYQGIEGVLEFNDFQVFWRAGEAGLSGGPGLYTVRADDGRPFIYPPPSALVLAPLALLPERVAGIGWSLAKLALLWLGVRLLIGQAEREGRGAPGHAPWAAALTLLCLYEPVRSDFSHGQINLLLLGLAVVATQALFYAPRPRPATGGALLALIALVKVSPGLYVALPLLHRRWRALAVAAGGLGAASLLATLWFGPEVWGAWSARSSSWIAGHPLDKYLRSLAELSTRLLRERDAAPGPGATRLLWACQIALLGGLHLGLRALRQRRVRTTSPLWDLAALSTGVVLVSPMARLAQEVAALPALLLGALHLLDRGGSPRRRVDAADVLTVASLLLFLLGRSLPFEDLVGVDATPLLAMVLAYLALLALPAPPAFAGARRPPPNTYATPTPSR